MIRFLATLLAGAALALCSAAVFPRIVPHSPVAVQNAAASLGIQQKPAATTPGISFTQTGPLSSAAQAESNKKYDEALQAVIAFRQSGGDAFVAAERMGWLYYLKGAYPEAEQAYTAATRLHSAALNPALGLLNVAEAMKDGRRIRAAADAVMRIEPSNYRAAMAVANSCFAMHDYRGAAFAYRRILTPYPDDVDARSGLAWSEYYTGDKQDPLFQFQTIISIYPDYPYAKQGLKLVSAVNGVAPGR